MRVRITAPLVPYGNVQFVRGQELDLPEDLAMAFVGRHEAELMPFAETATRPRPENAVVPRTYSKPKPPARPARRR